MMLSDEEIDLHLNKVLRASGSQLSYYSMQSTLSGMRTVMRDIERAVLAKALPTPKQEPVAWEAITEVYTKYITQSKYEKLGLGTRKWYKPYTCDKCELRAQAAAIPEWENEAKRAFWAGLEIGACMGSVKILPRWNEYIAKRKGELSAAQKPEMVRITNEDAEK